EQGFLSEEEALSVMSDAGVSLVGINRVMDRLLELGVIFADDAAAEDDDSDYAQIDYEEIYVEILATSSGQKRLIDYIRNVRPPQNREWRPLITQMNSGNQYAFSRLFDMYLRVVVRIALRFHKDEDFELDDAIQEGSMVLMRAIRQYDASKHGNLGSYLSLWILQYISKAAADKGRTIRLPVHVYEIVKRLKASRKKLYSQVGVIPSCDEVAEDAKVPVITAIKLFEAMLEPLSIEDLLATKGNEALISNCFSIRSVDEELDNAALAQKLQTLLLALPERESQVLLLRYGLHDGTERTLEEIGAIFNVTRERIRQIESKALRKLRHPTRAIKLKEFI
ncbi:MAG: sigma-70 family RNA polymerase sigma factor, partial [Lentisphaerae bacterium]|nr:sigma-70 family RNA polymerase sigma factor [Lentisphaerota bacterium]